MKLFIAPGWKYAALKSRNLFHRAACFYDPPLGLRWIAQRAAFMIFCDEQSAHIRGRPDEYNFLFRHCVAGASHFYNPKRVSQICIWTRRSSWERASAWRMRPLQKSKQTKALLCTRAKRGKGLRGCVENRREKTDSGYSTVSPCAQNKHTMHHNSRSVRALLLSNPLLTWPRTKIYGLHGKWNWRIVGNWAKIESFVKISCEWVFAFNLRGPLCRISRQMMQRRPWFKMHI